MAGLVPTLQEVLQRAIASALDDVWTSGVGRVVAYSPAAQTADVELVVTRPVPKADGTYAQETLPILPDVPVLFPQGGGFSLTWELAANDGLLVVYLKNSVDNWIRTGVVSEPGDLRTHHLAHAVAIPCVSRSALTADPDHATVLTAPAVVKIVAPEVQVNAATVAKVTSPEVRLGDATASQFAALAQKVDDNFNRIASWLAGTTAGGGAIPKWTPVPNDGGLALQTFVIQQLARTANAPDGAPVATPCSKVKIT